jgi:hypothetical protein
MAGVTDVVACGPPAIAALGELLVTPEPSGLFEVRCRAVAALAGLGAFDTLLAFLRKDHDLRDPVALAGEEAVVDAAARALIGVQHEAILPTLLDLAFWRPLSGVMDALGALRDPRAIPGLLEGLREDHTRRAAARALRAFVEDARGPLLELAGRADPDESVSSLRTRRSALGLLVEFGAPPDAGPILRYLSELPDPEIAAQACRLRLAEPLDARGAVDRLRALSPSLPPALREEVRRQLSAEDSVLQAPRS